MATNISNGRCMNVRSALKLSTATSLHMPASRLLADAFACILLLLPSQTFSHALYQPLQHPVPDTHVSAFGSAAFGRLFSSQCSLDVHTARVHEKHAAVLPWRDTAGGPTLTDFSRTRRELHRVGEGVRAYCPCWRARIYNNHRRRSFPCSLPFLSSLSPANSISRASRCVSRPWTGPPTTRELRTSFKHSHTSVHCFSHQPDAGAEPGKSTPRGLSSLSARRTDASSGSAVLEHGFSRRAAGIWKAFTCRRSVQLSALAA